MAREKKIKKIFEEIAIKVSTLDANIACPCISYQPKQPKSMKKLRKF